MPSGPYFRAYGVDPHLSGEAYLIGTIITILKNTMSPAGSTDPAPQLNRNSDLSIYFESSGKTADLRLSALSPLAFSLELFCLCASVWVRG